MASSSARLARKGREVCKYSFTWHPLRGTTLMGAEAEACREHRSVVTSNYIRMNVCTYVQWITIAETTGTQLSRGVLMGIFVHSSTYVKVV